MMKSSGDEYKVTDLDIQILNILRCEPPTLGFDFFSYGGLPRSVFALLQNKIPNLEEVILSKPCIPIDIPYAPKGGKEKHTLIYGEGGGVYSIFVNTHNKFSNVPDAKFFGRAEIQDAKGKKYDATFLALEVYREKGNFHPVWDLGFYVNEKEKNKILYEENITVDIPNTDKRFPLHQSIAQFIESMKELRYDPDWKGILHNPQKLKYLNSVIKDSKDIGIIGTSHFNQNRAKWFRYLSGTQPVEEIIKLQDLYKFGGSRIYRIELVSSHLISKKEEEYCIQILEDSEGVPISPNPRIMQEGPLPYDEALQRFLQLGNHFSHHLYIHAGKGRRQYDIAANWEKTKLKYAVIVRDSENNPITVTSWETPFAIDGNKLPSGKIHHYLELWGDSGPQRLDEGVYFEGIPRKFMGKLLEAMPRINYEDGKTFVDQAIKYEVPLISPNH